MAKWDADYTSPATAARIQGDIDDGTALGLTGTPSFFLNGQPFAPQSMEDLTQALDDALAA
jgi:protein-disulfide isomerase